MNIKDTVVIVTGSSSGIGEGIALRFAQEGAKVVVHYHVNKKGGEATFAKVKKLSKDSMLVQADLAKEKDVDRMFKEVLKKYGAVDILINNGAIGTDRKPFMEASYEDMMEMVNTDIMNVLMCSQRAGNIMKKQGRGKILSTSSVRGWEYGGRAPVYAACKAAVNAFTRTFAKQMAPEVHVNAVAPGFVKTRSYDSMTPEMIKGFLDQTYLKRWVTIEEIADAFVFLAKNDAMTGQVIYVEAGFMLT